LMNDPALCLNLGRTARERVINNYNLDMQSSLYRSTYDRLVYPRTNPTVRIEAEAVPELSVIQLPVSKELVSIPAFSSGADEKASFFVAGDGQVSDPLQISTLTGDINEPYTFQNYSGLFNASQNQPIQSTSLASDLQRCKNSLLNNETNEKQADLIPPMVIKQKSEKRSRNCVSTKDEIKPGETEQQVKGDIDKIAILAADTISRDPMPIDALEISAFLETQGITDDIARTHYSLNNTFELGEAVLSYRRSNGMINRIKSSPAIRKRKVSEILVDLSQGPMVLIPVFMTLIIIMVYGIYGGWAQKQVFLMSASFTIGMLIANVSIQSLCRRTSFYLSQKKPYIARKYLMLGMTIAGGVIVVIALLIAALALLSREVTLPEGVIIFGSLAGLSILWLFTGALSIIRRMVWVLIGILCGVLAGFIVNWIASVYTTAHLLIATAFGYGVTIFILFVAVYRGFFNKRDHRPTKSTKNVHFPRLAYLFMEGSPSAIYAALYTFFVLLPHFLGWYGSFENGLPFMTAVPGIEAGLTFAMLPLVLSAGIIEYTLKTYWIDAEVVQENTPGSEVPKFHQSMLQLYYRNLTIYISVFTLIGLSEYIIVRELFVMNRISTGLYLPTINQAMFIFSIGLVAFMFLGLGLYTCVFCNTLYRLRIAIQSVTIGCLVMILVGIPMIMIDYSFCVLAFMAGSLTFFVVAYSKVIKFLHQSDFYFLWAV
jgi:hypothetical protein